MNTILFDEFNSRSDFGLILQKKEVEVAVPSYNRIKPPGAYISADYSDVLGDVSYDDRVISFEFSSIKESFTSQFSMIINTLHAKKMKIEISDDPNYYYMGRVTVNKWSSNTAEGNIYIECLCDPFKYKKDVTVYEIENIDTNEYTLQNDRMMTSVTITSDAECVIQYNSINIAVVAGTKQYENILLQEGKNVIVIVGAANLSIEYQEGCF